jgi:hypothetical protein
VQIRRVHEFLEKLLPRRSAVGGHGATSVVNFSIFDNASFLDIHTCILPRGIEL